MSNSTLTLLALGIIVLCAACANGHENFYAVSQVLEAPVLTPPLNDPDPSSTNEAPKVLTACTKNGNNTGVFLFDYTYPGQITERDLPNALLTVTAQVKTGTGSYSQTRTQLVNGPLKNYLSYVLGNTNQGLPFIQSISLNLPPLNVPDSARIDIFACVPQSGVSSCVPAGALSDGGRGNSLIQEKSGGSTKADLASMQIELRAFHFIHPAGATALAQWFSFLKTSTVCSVWHSPLILDLNGNGLALQGPDNGVRFDMQASGVKQNTGWVKAGEDDAFLVRDLNENGSIDSGAELFGNSTRLADGTNAANGFEALKALDQNQDGEFTPEEDRSVKLWLDRNANARTDRGELVSLKSAGVISISLDYVHLSESDEFGNQTRQRALFQREQLGQTFSRIIADIWFRAE